MPKKKNKKTYGYDKLEGVPFDEDYVYYVSHDDEREILSNFTNHQTNEWDDGDDRLQKFW